jgi:hypothetical protein
MLLVTSREFTSNGTGRDLPQRHPGASRGLVKSQIKDWCGWNGGVAARPRFLLC